MKRNLRSFFVIFLILLCIGGVFAQATALLTIEASEGPAQVLLNGKLLGIANPKFATRVKPGTYDLIVRKTGLPEFRQKITIPASGLTVQAQLGAAAVIPAPQPVKQLFTLTITANAPNAQVSVNGSAMGNAPVNVSVEAGTYRVQISAPGYENYDANVSVTNNTSLAATLKQQASKITITANVQGAEVYLNNVKTGTTPFTTDLPFGSYNLKVSAPGYQDYAAGIVVNGPQTIVANLIPLMATLKINIPERYLGKQHKNPLAQVELYVDNIKQKDLTIAVNPGTHNIRLEFGVLAIESNVVCEAGKTYTLEPSFGFTVK
ncbi:PEGA domain-containing protein [Gracilinema caldarium]|uniref:PEGA domain-containing protein n=1 Tax=Gracilinema caldarium TaxID=215591 RepID=UPI0026EE6DFD|nr:PEGA domain-containing protein [Gracilinema caldarium]